MSPIRLGVNIDHVATIRNARGGLHPDPVRAADIAIRAGADGITAHLREDRRHISDTDIARLAQFDAPLNLEIAPTKAMLTIAKRHRPSHCCIVPEKRQELTTEGGLRVVGMRTILRPYIEALHEAGIRVFLFVEPNDKDIDASADLDADGVELHTGHYCEMRRCMNAKGGAQALKRLYAGAARAAKRGLDVHAGHGLTYQTVGAVAEIDEVTEVNIGHFLIGDAIFQGLTMSIRSMRNVIDKARAGKKPRHGQK